MAILTFQPVLQSKIWGGRNLEKLFGREIPEGAAVGESWELVDRAEAQSVLCSDGRTTLHDLWSGADRKKVFGKRAPDCERFPILIKILDAADKLSVQAHPPAGVAKKLKGEPKTEMWYFLHAEPGAKIYAGFKRKMNRVEFEKALGEKRAEEYIYSFHTKPYEAMFLPAGRIHAIGGGNVLLEIQQSSDTTYRVYDWDRADADGKKRDLHVEQAMESIHFDDVEPYFAQPHGERIIRTEFFEVRRAGFYEKEIRDFSTEGESFQHWFVTQGELKFGEEVWKAGKSVFVTADSEEITLSALTDYAEMVVTMFPAK